MRPLHTDEVYGTHGKETPIHTEKRMQQLDSQRRGDVGTAETIEHEHTDRTSVKAGTEFVCAT